ncbi:MAG: hypothetical protein U9R34_02105 [Nanoarchaeota archaeon]|nr:hypothetical protein [Nanoarchaeota archaeon]
MAEKSEVEKKKPVEAKVDVSKEIGREIAEKKKSVKKKKNDGKSISNVIKAKKLMDSVDGKKSIDNKVTSHKGAKSLFGNAEYMHHLLKQQENMLDYSKLFLHFGKKKYDYNSYDTYSSAYKGDFGKAYLNHETISPEAVDRIIEDSMIENMCGFSLNRATIEEKEAFKVYAMFNRTLIQLKYSMGL